jgi:hypothetical protein
MGRPIIRTSQVGRATVELVREVFGTAANAYKNLRVSSEVTFAVFSRAWNGQPVTPQAVRAIERGWTRWARRLIKVMGTETGEIVLDEEREA